MRTYNYETCGVCGRGSPDVRWPAPPSPFAHSVCIERIQEIDTELYNLLRAKTKNSLEAHLSHYKVIAAVKEELGKVTILEYANQNGLVKLRELFHSKISPEARL